MEDPRLPSWKSFGDEGKASDLEATFSGVSVPLVFLVGELLLGSLGWLSNRLLFRLLFRRQDRKLRGFRWFQFWFRL